MAVGTAGTAAVVVVADRGYGTVNERSWFESDARMLSTMRPRFAMSLSLHERNFKARPMRRTRSIAKAAGVRRGFTHRRSYAITVSS